jgi:hypothetical protein
MWLSVGTWRGVGADERNIIFLSCVFVPPTSGESRRFFRVFFQSTLGLRVRRVFLCSMRVAPLAFSRKEMVILFYQY